jgi:hypothetical protein
MSLKHQKDKNWSRIIWYLLNDYKINPFKIKVLKINDSNIANQ